VEGGGGEVADAALNGAVGLVVGLVGADGGGGEAYLSRLTRAVATRPSAGNVCTGRLLRNATCTRSGLPGVAMRGCPFCCEFVIIFRCRGCSIPWRGTSRAMFFPNPLMPDEMAGSGAAVAMER